MRVLFLNPAGRVGGAERALLDAIAAVIEARPAWGVGLIVGADGPLASHARALGADVRVLPFPPALARLGERSYSRRRWSRLAVAARSLQSVGPAWRYLSRLASALEELAPDIVQTNGLKMHLLGTWARPPGTATVWHLHDYVTRRPFSATLLKRSMHRCAAAVANSRSVADDFRTLGGAVLPARPIWNAVDLERFSPEGDSIDLDALSGLPAPDAGVVRVGLIATFAVWKGHRTFLDAIARLPASLNVRAYVIGGEIYETGASQISIGELREASARLGLMERVGFTGVVDDPASAMRALDVVVHASTEPEPFGLTIAEGLACGRPVVVSLAGGAAEIVTPGVDALAFSPGDVNALARCIEQLALDATLRRRLALAARATAERSFQRRRLARELVEVYDRVAPEASLHVLHVHSGNLYGGVETFLTTLARDGVVAPGMRSSFALCFEGRLSMELREHGQRPAMLGRARLSRPHTVWRARRRLATLLAGQRFDVVVCHQAWAQAIFGSTVRRAGLPLVFWQHTSGDGRHWLERYARSIVPALTVANSQFTARHLARWFPRTPLEVVYCPLRVAAAGTPDPVVRHDLRQSLDTPQSDVVIVQVGRLESGKGNREALEALATLRDVDGWTHWIVGGPQRPSDERYLRQLEEIARRSGITGRVRFVGERSDVGALLQAADVYCQPNVRPEPFGLGLVEAQAAGLPIVTSAAGGALEIVDEHCGRLVPPGDIAALAATLHELMSDPALRSQLGRAGRERSGVRCDLTRQMLRTHEVLSSVASKRRDRVAHQPPALSSSAHS